jgi:hypothetical protein
MLTSFNDQRVLQSVIACFRYLSVLSVILTCIHAVHTDLGTARKTTQLATQQQGQYGQL